MNRKEMIKEYKITIQPMGIVQVKNLKNGRVYLTASANTPGTINSIRFQLKMGTFLPCAALARDWKELESRASPSRCWMCSSRWMMIPGAITETI